MSKNEKPIEWIGGSYKDLLKMPAEVRKNFGHALHLAQNNDRHQSTKTLRGFGGSDVIEILEDYNSDTYRAIYTTRFQGKIFVLHCFQKKSKNGNSTPKVEIETIRTRLNIATKMGKDEI